MEQIDLIIAVDSDGAKTATSDLSALEKQGTKAEKATAKLAAKADKLTKALQAEAAKAGMTARQIKLLELADAKATKEQIKLANSAMDVTEKAKKQAKATANAAKSAGKTGGPFRAMRGSLQQVSWQLQDVAVQTQMGTDKFMILGQQGPQLASVFGPGGAVLGALIAFGAIAGGFVYRAITGTGEAMKELAEDAKELRTNFDDLGPAAQKFQRFLAAKEIEEARKNLENLNKEKKAGAKVMMDERTGRLTARETPEKFAIREMELDQKIERQTLLIEAKQEAVDNLTTRTQDLIASLNEEIRVTGESAEVVMRGSRAYLEASASQKKTIDGLIENNVTKKTEIELDKEKIKNDVKILSITANLNKVGIKGVELLKLQQAEKLKALKDAGASGSVIKAAKDNLQREMDAAVESERIRTEAEKTRVKNKQDAEDKRDVAADVRTKKRLAKLSQNTMDENALINALAKEQINFELQQFLAKATTTEQYLQAILDIETAAQVKREELRNKDAESRTKDNDKAIAEAKSLAAAKAQIENQALQSAQNIATSLHGIAEEGSKEAKVLFAIQKAIAIAQIIVATEQAAALASAYEAGGGPIAWLAAKEGIRAMGYASVGIVAGTAIAGGRALGGQVRGGESYLVGERGPELLTMGTSGRVTSNDSLKNSGNGADVVINQTINVTTGIQSTVRAEIVALMPQISNAAKGAVADARLRGGNFSKAMAGA